jgi:RNA polymerase sigma-70 factor (ECF subfamily)
VKDRVLDDEAIMAAILNGRKSAMKALVEKYKRKAYYLAMGMVGNSDEAFDISQEAFVRVFRSAKRYNPGQKFFPWFYSIIVNLCRDVLKRREAKESREVSIDDNAFLLVDSANPEAELIRKEEAECIRRALMQLDFDDREIIMLRHFRDLSYQEISSLLKIPRGTVMSRLYYARKKLARLLNEI